MRRILIVLMVAFATNATAQTGDGGSGWANWLLNQVEWAKSEIRENKTLASTIELVRIYKETQQLTGVVASTITDLKKATLKFQNDIQNIDDVSQSQLDQLNAYFSWEDALTGKNYPSLLNLEQWYTDELATFRDKDGHLNAATLLFNTISVEDQMNNQRAYYAMLYKVRSQKRIYIDKEISRLLHLSKEYDNQARHLVIKLNLTVFNKSMTNIASGLGKVFKGDTSKEKTKRSDSEIQAQIDKVYELQDKAAKARSEALNLLYELMLEDMNSQTIDLMAWRMLQDNPQEIPKLEVPRNFIAPNTSISNY